MLNRYLKLALLLFMISSTSPVIAGSSLAVNCYQAGGVVLSGQYLDNFNIINKLSSSSNAPAVYVLNVEYNKYWYYADNVAISSFLSLIQIALTMDVKVDLCVTSTVTTPDPEGDVPYNIIGIQFTHNF